MVTTPTPQRDIRVFSHQIPAHGLIPNTSIQHKPLLIYRGAFPVSATASDIEHHLLSTGVVTPQWRYTMYSTDHFHSTSHEVLCIAAGRAKLCFGGEENSKRVETVAEKGDVLIVPAGVSHRLLEDLQGGLQMVGSYPVGMAWDMCYGRKGEEEKVARIKDLNWFDMDPVYGEGGLAVDC